jgi:sortase A
MTDEQPGSESAPTTRRDARRLAEQQESARRPTETTPRQKRGLGSRIIGVAGELLITAGVFVLLFLGWQLWWNSIVLTNDQASSASTLADQWKTESPSASPTPTPSSTAPAAPTAPVGQGEPIVMGEPSETTDFAILYVPRFGADFKRTITEGVDPKTVLNKGGAGHYPDTGMPGAVGNFAIAAHRDGWGSAFININELRIGDPIYVETQDGWYTYRFRSSEYVSPFGVGVIDPVPQSDGAPAADRLITLTSCNPLYIASERIIAYGVFESWQPRSAGPPADIAKIVGSGA